ncbi:MAG: DUF86 domain-containing protein [Deltaproteobacteria bacterium]|nr:DUF86 domain-containing protein [Deltaproteobacteria bacterium]
MVIARLDTTRIAELLRFIETCIGELRPYGAMNVDEFMADKRNPAFVESYLRRALEAVFDIGRHILAKSYGFKDIEYKSIGKELGERSVITRDLSEKLIVMAGYRNRMVHFYREITAAELHRIIAADLSDVEEFTREIARFLEAAAG